MYNVTFYVFRNLFRPQKLTLRRQTVGWFSFDPLAWTPISSAVDLNKIGLLRDNVHKMRFINEQASMLIFTIHTQYGCFSNDVASTDS